jgi:hypothetical protein
MSWSGTKSPSKALHILSPNKISNNNCYPVFPTIRNGTTPKTGVYATNSITNPLLRFYSPKSQSNDHPLQPTHSPKPPLHLSIVALGIVVGEGLEAEVAEEMEEEIGATTAQADDQTTAIWEELYYPLTRLSLRMKI